MTRNVEKAGADFEKMIRKELGVSSPVPWSVEEIQQKSKLYSVGEFLAVFGGSLSITAKLVYNLPAPLPSELHIGVIQVGINTFPAILQFVAELSKTIAGKATYGQTTSLLGEFRGDLSICEKLNGNKEVLTLASKLYRGKITASRVSVNIIPALEVSGDGQASHLMVRNVMYVKGFTGLYQVKEFLQLRSLIELSVISSWVGKSAILQQMRYFNRRNQMNNEALNDREMIMAQIIATHKAWYIANHGGLEPFKGLMETWVRRLAHSGLDDQELILLIADHPARNRILGR